MSQEMIISLARDALSLVLLLSAPALGVGLLVGLAISILQATTQIQEQTLTFVPKIIAVFLAILIFGKWMLTILVSYAANIFGNLSNLVH
ncbi:flagellar biosynthetic protein FliQ [Desulfonispora thiosulfatigenes DSM 11270]|uniref:Flagellar biosynthetic protein FliQ n=1 Tax=Desulfonispora thiosulfatigenes DSM 11270 TaxID=656914 RepID=A0A1W1UMS4_DESTI|nr:flagellar biosynthesis protein FliQ [Desulfonispora thiosulfatigenes]SMB82370.1 flagellar biosynthetic protein FliQ [Desulfonispora thiosulfatigenes DSM 11270]